METREAAERFVRVWRRAWAEHDVDALLELYAESCVHRSMPFREPHRGRAELAEYLRWSFAAERVTDVRFSAPVVGAGGVAVAEFRVLAEEEGAPITLAGCVLARFDAAGLAVETRDYWHTVEGHREPEDTLFLG
ncbi:nuclear transport factor 2 family protein [Streptomyces sp. uw30]|uniref:nuclear transport factor 2 family protein n=1 Tax=Streptomyces sp. uw30 TaxID=1828179 RepID=UPI0011CD3836|nr:nuclear transport factor 2 family protein [Streptomyces sp. uw30]TXS46493.1 nuclear transport factor 2 family protein [Streptomyces sp. uw30]